MKSEEINHSIFKISILLTYIAYFAGFFGILYIDDSYIRAFSTFIQFSVCIFLMIRFSPLRKTYDVTKLDVSIIFYCATFLLINVVFIEVYTILPRNTVSDTIYKLVEKK